MIANDKVKQLDDSQLVVELEERLEILDLCIEAVTTNHQGTDGLYWAFGDAKEIIEEMKSRIKEGPE